MATYIFECNFCGHSESVRVAMEKRNEIQICPNCGEESFRYNFIKTMRGSNVVVHEDIVSFMERKMASSKVFQAPHPSGAGVAGKTSGRAGAGRHFMGDPKHTKKWI